MDNTLAKKLAELKRASERLQLLSSHDALVLLRASCSSPKLIHLIRSSPCTDHRTLFDIDNCLRLTLSNITNVNMLDNQWKQASLPVKAGGLGVRCVSSIAPPAFLSSATSTQQLQSLLLAKCSWEHFDRQFDIILNDWCQVNFPVLPPTGIAANKQRSWDKPLVDATYKTLLAAQPDDYHRARLIAASAAHSGDWLNTLPISACGLRLDNDAIRIAVGLRLGSNICEPHICTCGTSVSARGNHGLSCKRSAGRRSRHSYINDIVYHALVKAGIPSSKEPVGLLRTDGKRPDGLTLVPWKAGKNVVWDVTVADTLATSYLSSTSITAGSAAELAANRKEEKYVELTTTHTFVPLAFETLGPICSKALVFLRELGRRLTLATDDNRETVFLFQRLSIAIQRFNAVCFAGTLSNHLSDCD